LYNNYDYIEIGSKTKSGEDGIRYVKKMSDGTIYFVEAIKNNDKRLSAKTMYKKKAGAINAEPNPITSKTTPIKIIQNPNKNVKQNPSNNETFFQHAIQDKELRTKILDLVNKVSKRKTPLNFIDEFNEIRDILEQWIELGNLGKNGIFKNVIIATHTSKVDYDGPFSENSIGDKTKGEGATVYGPGSYTTIYNPTSGAFYRFLNDNIELIIKGNTGIE
jgi:hypothetical protein